MRVIALFGRGDIGKTHCLGHLINLMHRELCGQDYIIEGQDTRCTFNYLGRRITVCTWGDTGYEAQKNLDTILQANPDIAVVATRTKGDTVDLVGQFCVQYNHRLKWVEKYVATIDDFTGQEYVNHLQAQQILDYIREVVLGRLYYVDSVSAIEVGEQRNYHVSLIDAEIPEGGIPRMVSLELNSSEIRYPEVEQEIQEDDFVLYHPDSDNLFQYANDIPRAAELRNESLALRQALVEREVRGEAALAIVQDPIWVKSYHVKVGHGNCSLILTKYEGGYDLWMVDCSTYDYLIRCDYSLDLLCCLKGIAGELKIDVSRLHISRFMLTHTHFDHYSGMPYLINQGLIDGTTLMYVNLHYDCASPLWSRILKGLQGLKCMFVEPIGDNMTRGAIKLFHPECRIYKKNNGIPAGMNCRVVPNANDASVVYAISLLGKIMVLPGDLEKKGFENMRGARRCSADLNHSDYYVVSHHGSINGHPMIQCQPIPSVLECATNNLKKTILMGRNGAYSGIYSQVVTRYWQSQNCGLEYTEKAQHYLVLNWGDDSVVYQ